MTSIQKNEQVTLRQIPKKNFNFDFYHVAWFALVFSFKYPSEDDGSSIISGSDPSGVHSSPQPQSGTLLNTVPTSHLPEVRLAALTVRLYCRESESNIASRWVYREWKLRFTLNSD